MLDLLKRVFLRHHRAPVSKALSVDAGSLEKQVENAIAAIDRVHTDGTLPALRVKSAVLMDMYGYFQNTTDGKAVEIVVSLLNPHVELTTIHEIGHFLDFKGLDRSTLWDGTRVEYPVDKSYVGYLLKAEELWARSYSQFIAIKSRDPLLLRQLEQEQKRPVSGIYYPKHWDEADFQPVLAEMETIFRGLRWMR